MKTDGIVGNSGHFDNEIVYAGFLVVPKRVNIYRATGQEVHVR